MNTLEAAHASAIARAVADVFQETSGAVRLREAEILVPGPIVILEFDGGIGGDSACILGVAWELDSEQAFSAEDGSWTLMSRVEEVDAWIGQWIVSNLSDRVVARCPTWISKFAVSAAIDVLAEHDPSCVLAYRVRGSDESFEVVLRPAAYAGPRALVGVSVSFAHNQYEE